MGTGGRFEALDPYGSRLSHKYGTHSYYDDYGARAWDVLFEKEPSLFQLLNENDPGDEGAAREIQEEFKATVDRISPDLYDSIITVPYDHRRLYSIYEDALDMVVEAAGLKLSDLNYLADHGNGAQMIRDAVVDYERTTGYTFGG